MKPAAAEPACLAVDLHVHTGLSPDSLTALPAIVEAVCARGLSALAITDHNEVDAALRLQEVAPFPVIVGEEVKTTQGEIIGLFLQRRVPKNMSPQETIAAIREQRGLVYLPHPFDIIRRSTIVTASIAAIIDQVDIIEVLNSRVLWPYNNRAALRLAEAHGIPGGAGSDAHTPGEIGRAYVVVPRCDLADPQSFLIAVRQGRVAGGTSSPLRHPVTLVAKLIKRLGLAPRTP